MSKGKEGISEEKMRKIAVGATVGGVLLIVFLVVILVVQFVRLGVANAKSRELDAQIEEYERLLEKEERDLAFYESETGLQYLAQMNGWK